ncbi:probable chitinase 2 [Periplaneta americana]|uniref:probable chitinase 2 n=1 Tax=Periplaneta americana TaxID=6978 RepID=UPI0037E7DD3B
MVDTAPDIQVVEGSSSESEPESESESDNELATIPGPSPSQLAGQTPPVFVENSSNIHIGPNLQYNGPVTVKQYITVNGKDEVSYNSSDDTPHLHNLGDFGLQPEKSKPQNEACFGKSSEVLLETPKGIFGKKRCILCGAVVALLLLVVVIVTVAVALSGSGEDPNKIKFSYQKDDITVKEGLPSFQWAVKVEGTSPTELVWYDPDCNVIERRIVPSPKREVYISPTRDETTLTINNISIKDRGRYRLQARNEHGEAWSYFTLRVQGNTPHKRDYVVVCYVAQWARYRTGRGNFTVDEIQPELCTHLIYAFAELNVNTATIYSADPAYDLRENNGSGAYEKMVSLKKEHPHLKVLLSMGGWAERSKNYSIVASNPVKRTQFALSVSEFLRKYNFDGFDFHWQFPAEPTGVPADKQYFVEMLKELREEFDKYNLLLTVPLGVLPDVIARSYDVPAISKYLDYMFAMCYAYYTHWGPETGPNAPLYALRTGDPLNVEASIKSLIKMGAPPNKLVLGMPLYGRVYQLRDQLSPPGFRAPSIGAPRNGPYVQEPGFWGYNEICLELGSPIANWRKFWDIKTHTPYAISQDNIFLSYDNETSLTDKVELAVQNKLAGVMVWSLDTDDFLGDCIFERTGATSFPLMRAINKALDTAAFGEKMPCRR